MIIRSSESGIAFSAKGQALITGITSPASFSAPKGSDDEIERDVAIWGSDNNLPGRMMKDIEATGVLAAATDTKARIAVGKGPMLPRIKGYTEDGYEQLEFIADGEIQDWLDANNSFECSYASVLDLFRTRNSFRQILLSSDRKIIGYKRHDPSQCRFSKIDPHTQKSEKVYLSGDWTRYTSKTDKEHFDTVPLLSKDYPVIDLQSRTKDYSFMIATQYPLFGRQYYSPAP